MPDTSPVSAPAAAAAPAPLQLQRFTTSYDASQDRICLAGQGGSDSGDGSGNDSRSGGGPVHTLWLTQRMVRRLLPALWQWLERYDAPQTDAAPLAPAPSSPRTAALHEMAQQAARTQMPAQAPVKPGLFSPQWLVCSVQMRASAQSVELLLSNALDESAPPALDHASAQLDLSAQPLRQWLSILLQLHQQAEWSVDHWPRWLTSATDTPTAAQGGPVLH